MQQGDGQSGYSQIPVRWGNRPGVRLGPAPGRCALGAARAERSSHWGVASSSLGDSPGPAKGGRTCQPGCRARTRAGGSWGWVAPRLVLGSGEQGGRTLGPPGLRLSIRSALSLGKPACLWTWRREKWRAAFVFEPLFFGWKGNDGRGQLSSGCSNVRLQPLAVISLLGTACPALGLRASLWPRFSLPSASAMPLSLALCWPLVPLPLHLLSTVPPHSHTPGTLATEVISKAYVVNTGIREDRERS